VCVCVDVHGTVEIFLAAIASFLS